MLQQLAQDTGAEAWAIGSMLFFIAVFAWVVIRIFRTPKAEHEANANLPLNDGSDASSEATDR